METEILNRDMQSCDALHTKKYNQKHNGWFVLQAAVGVTASTTSLKPVSDVNRLKVEECVINVLVWYPTCIPHYCTAFLVFNMHRKKHSNDFPIICQLFCSVLCFADNVNDSIYMKMKMTVCWFEDQGKDKCFKLA